MKKLFLLTLLLLPVSIFSMNDAPSFDPSVRTIARQVVERQEQELKAAQSAQADRELEDAFAAFKPGLQEFQIDKNDMLNKMRAQQALVKAKCEQQAALINAKKAKAGQASDSENLYAEILGKNFHLISDDMSDQEREQQIKNVWDKEKERIKQQALAALEGMDGAFVEDIMKLNMPEEMASQLSPEQKDSMLDLMRTSALEATEQNGYTILKNQVAFVRAVLAVHNNQTHATSATHHTVQ